MTQPATVWRVQWYAITQPGTEIAEGRLDFDTGEEARAYFASAEVQSRVGPYWRAELQLRPSYPWVRVEDTGYRGEAAS